MRGIFSGHFLTYLLRYAAVMEAIPNIVCDTLYSLGLHDQTPSWKIMDNKGRITVVLHWEPEASLELAASARSLPAIAGPSRQSSTCSTIASGGPRLLGIHARSISQVVTRLLFVYIATLLKKVTQPPTAIRIFRVLHALPEQGQLKDRSSAHACADKFRLAQG